MALKPPEYRPSSIDLRAPKSAPGMGHFASMHPPSVLGRVVYACPVVMPLALTHSKVFYNAINLYRESRTSKGEGPALTKDLGPKILDELDSNLRNREIGWAKMGYDLGSSHLNAKGPDILVNQMYTDSLPAVSMILVHEAAHLVQRKAGDPLYLVSEVRCRQIVHPYFDELLNRLTYTPPGSTPLPDYPVGPGTLDVDKEREPNKSDQLADYLLANMFSEDDKFHKKPEYARGLNADWIRRNQSMWGGLANRWATTKGLYVKILAAAAEPTGTDGVLIVEIMQTIKAQDHWDEMMRHVRSDFRRVQRAVALSLSRAPQQSRAVREQKIRELEQRWNVKLTR
jgi:hypothetical protein